MKTVLRMLAAVGMILVFVTTAGAQGLPRAKSPWGRERCWQGWQAIQGPNDVCSKLTCKRDL